MAEITLFLLILLGVWLARTAHITKQSRWLLAQLTSRIYLLEEELKQLKNLISDQGRRGQTAPAPKPEPALAPAETREIVEPLTAPPLPQPAPEPSAPALPVISIPPTSASPPPPAFTAGEPSGPSWREQLHSLVSLEETLGTNWLNKLGIIILVVGVALFLAYELRELGPPGKVTVGYSVSLAMLGAGVVFERRERWRILARAGVAGGWALIYFTTYALYHVGAMRVISSETVDLVLLLAVAAPMVLHTLRYQSQVVSGLTFLLAFTTINISRGNAYSLIASALLSAGLVAVALRRGWYEMEIAGMAAAYLNHYLWLRPIIEPMHGHIHSFPGYAASAMLVTGYWLIFRASYVVRQVASERQERISSLGALLNPALFMSVMSYQSVHPEKAFEFLLAVGSVEIVLGQLPITRRRRSAFVILTTIGSCLLVAALPYRYSGAALTVSWLAEAEALLLAGVFLREVLFRRLGMLAALVVWIQMLGADAAMVFGERMYGVRLTGRPGLALLFGAAVAVLYANAHWIPRRWPDLIQTDLERLCFRRFSSMAAILAIAGAWIAWPGAWTTVAWSVLGLALAFAGRRWRLQELSLEGMGIAAATVLRVLVINFAANRAYAHAPWLTERLLTVSLVAVLLYLDSRWAGVSGIAGLERISPAYTWAASALVGLLAWYELRPVAVALGWALLGLVLLETGLKRQSEHLRLQAYLALASSFVRLFFVNLNAAASLSGELSPRVYTTLPLALAFCYSYRRLVADRNILLALEQRIKVAECFSFLATITLAALMRFELDVDWVVAAWAGLVLALAAISWKTKERLFLDQGLLLGFAVLFRTTLHNFYQRSYFPAPFWYGRVASVGSTVLLLLLVLHFAFSLRRPAAETPARPWHRRMLTGLDQHPEQVFFFIPFVLLTVLLALEVRWGLVTLAWGVEAVGVFLFAIWVKERSYRLSGLGLLLVCVGKILLHDVWDLAPRDRYLTFIVLGSALLAVSFLYTKYREVLRQYL